MLQQYQLYCCFSMSLKIETVSMHFFFSWRSMKQNATIVVTFRSFFFQSGQSDSLVPNAKIQFGIVTLLF